MSYGADDLEDDEKEVEDEEEFGIDQMEVGESTISPFPLKRY